MAANCPYYLRSKCANPNGDHTHDCSWDRADFDQCAVYVLITDPVRGLARLLGGASITPTVDKPPPRGRPATPGR